MKAIRAAALSAAGLAASVAVVAGVDNCSAAEDSALNAEAVVDASGNLHVPHDYRITYEFLGTWAVAADQGQGSDELHFVYASPGTVSAYRKDGHFPDGAVLVKEVFRAATGPMTTGTVSRADSLSGWFVMVRDSKGRYAGDKLLWGEGWGWSWFDAANPSTPSVNLSRKGGGTAPSTDCRMIANLVISPRKHRTGSTLVGTRP